MDVLYLSYDGMTDALGRSQVIPYLAGLSKKGHRIHVISCEKRDSYAQDREEVKAIFAENQIGWNTMKYSTIPPLHTKV